MTFNLSRYWPLVGLQARPVRSVGPADRLDETKRNSSSFSSLRLRLRLRLSRRLQSSRRRRGTRNGEVREAPIPSYPKKRRRKEEEIEAGRRSCGQPSKFRPNLQVSSSLRFDLHLGVELIWLESNDKRGEYQTTPRIAFSPFLKKIIMQC